MLSLAFVFAVIAAFSQNAGWDKLKEELSHASNDSTQVLAYYKTAASIYRSTPKEAKEIALKGYELAQEKDIEEVKIDLLNLLGVIDSKLQNFNESIATHFKVLKMREKRGDKKGMMLSLLNIGNVFNMSYDPEQALIYYEKSLVIAKEIKDVRNHANIVTNIGNVLAQRGLNDGKQKDVATAISYILKTIDFYKKNLPEEEIYNSQILLGNLYIKQGDVNKAAYYTDLAIDHTDKNNLPVPLCYARVNRANVMVLRGQFKEAEQEVERIKSIIRKKPEFSFLTEELNGDFEKIAKAVKEGDTNVILSDKDSAQRQLDEDAETLRVKIREELREKYDTEKKELENKNLLLENQAIERESNGIKLLWGGTSTLLLTFVLMFFLLRKKNQLLREEKRKVEKARDEIEEQADQIRQQHTELVQADRFRSRIFSVVSHDLRAPIANFQVLLSISKLMDLPAEEVKKNLLIIGQEVEMASKMLDELLVWSSQQMSNETLEMTVIHVSTVVEDCRSLFESRLLLKKLTIENLISPQLTVLGDMKRFEFILRNILSNAIKFSFLGKHITVSSEESEKEIIIAIADEGAGMDEKKLASLQRQDMQESYLGTLQEKGAGIGLMLCHEFANRMGWYIRMESKLGFGSVFFVCIPKR